VAPAQPNGITDRIARTLKSSRKLNFIGLVSVIFFTVSGGGFGVETLVGKTGAFWAVILLLITPVLWSLPIALMVSEMSSAMPREGGYFIWVKRALGDFWGFQEGWWKMCFSAVDMAIFPVLFVSYLSFFVPVLALPETGSPSWEVFFGRWAVCVGVIFAGFLVNYSGVRFVGYNAIFNIGLVLVPFLIFSYFGFSFGETGTFTVVRDAFDAANNPATLIAIGLATVMWNYSGWDNVSTFAGEVNDASRNYPRALMVAVPLTILAYLVPVLAGMSITTDPEMWSDAYGFPAIAEMLGSSIGVSWLGPLIAIAALISMWSLFNSQLLYVSRVPFAMAEAGWLPKGLARLSKKTQTPIVALAVCCVVSAIFAGLPFTNLVVIAIIFYVGALGLQFISFLRLRQISPEMERPFRVKGGWPIAILISVLPALFATVVILATLSDPENNLKQLYVVGGAVVVGIGLYFWRKSHILVSNIS
jgi:amino acid transporter